MNAKQLILNNTKTQLRQMCAKQGIPVAPLDNKVNLAHRLVSANR